MFSKTYTKISGRDALVVTGLGSYSLKDTFECGQCFRYESVPSFADGVDEYVIVVGEYIINVAQRAVGELIFFEIEDDIFEKVARPFFALDTDLNKIKSYVEDHTESEWLRGAAQEASGIAILKQDPWQTLFSFIISQNNNIPRIRKIIREICVEYGVNLCLQKDKEKKCPISGFSDTPCEYNCRKCGICYTFPSSSDVLAHPEKLLPSKPGFRYKYLVDAATAVENGDVDLHKISNEGRYSFTLEELKKIKGVGDKVASCVALFAFNNLEAFPIDVWMKKAIDTYFGGELDPLSFGEYSGYAQQYIFHKIRNIENNKRN